MIYMFIAGCVVGGLVTFAVITTILAEEDDYKDYGCDR